MHDDNVSRKANTFRGRKFQPLVFAGGSDSGRKKSDRETETATFRNDQPFPRTGLVKGVAVGTRYCVHCDRIIHLETQETHLPGVNRKNVPPPACPTCSRPLTFWRQHILSEVLKTGDGLFLLRRERENAYDASAVAVDVRRQSGLHHVGYLPMADSETGFGSRYIAPFLDAGKPLWPIGTVGVSGTYPKIYSLRITIYDTIDGSNR